MKYEFKHLNIDDVLNTIVKNQEEKDLKDKQWEEKRQNWLNSLRFD